MISHQHVCHVRAVEHVQRRCGLLLVEAKPFAAGKQAGRREHLVSSSGFDPLHDGGELGVRCRRLLRDSHDRADPLDDRAAQSGVELRAQASVRFGGDGLGLGTLGDGCGAVVAGDGGLDQLPHELTLATEAAYTVCTATPA